MRPGILWLVLLALLLGACEPGPVPPPVPATSATQAAGRETIGFRSPQRLAEHFEKHGAEFHAASPQEYLALAQALRDRPAGGDVLEIVRADGVVTRFDRASGAFLAFERHGVIRTFFIPNDGERYFRRQATRQRR